MTPTEWHRLVTAIHDFDAPEAAVEACAEIKARATTADIPLLLGLLEDDSFFVREAAAWPLSDLGCVDALPQLLAAYQRGLDEGHDNDGMSAALADLVCGNQHASRVRLEALARGDALDLRAHAAWLLEFCDQ